MKDWLIIDGYNLIHQIFADDQKDDIARLRRNLLIRLEPLVNMLARRITVVFDGQMGQEPDKPDESDIIEVIYSPSNRTADSIIENLVWKAEHPENILVVTSDRLEREAVSASGADTMASSIFISMIREQSGYLNARIDKFNKRHENITFGDFFPEIKRD